MNNILITSVGQRVVLTEIFKKTVVELGLDSQIFTADMNPKYAPAGYVSDRCFKVCRCLDSEYIPQIMDICRNYGIKLIVPTIDTELQILSQNKSLFHQNGIDVLVSDHSFVDICRDKRKTSDLFLQLGINVPRTIDKYHPSFPMFAKPYDGSLSTNLHVIKSAEEMTTEIMSDPKLIFMEYIDKREFAEYSVDMYYGKDHYVKEIVPRERLKIRAGEINKGITRKNHIVDFLKERMNFMDGVIGSLCIQLFYRESDNQIYGIEINPRFGGGYPLSYYAKANYPGYIIREYLLGQTLDYSDDWLSNTLMLRYDNDIILYEQ